MAISELGQRNTDMHAAAKAMRQDGRSYTDILEAMVARNEVCCVPPLPYMEVAQIVHQVCLDDVKACG